MARRKYTFKNKRRFSDILPKRRGQLSRSNRIFGRSAAGSFFSRNKKDIVIVTSVAALVILAVVFIKKWQPLTEKGGEPEVAITADEEMAVASDTGKAEEQGEEPEEVDAEEPEETDVTAIEETDVKAVEAEEQAGTEKSEVDTAEQTEEAEQTDAPEKNDAGSTEANGQAEAEAEKEDLFPGEAKTIYLTFNGGPSQYTEKILDVLDKYDSKGTFFVTGAAPDYYYLINRASSSGHSIGVYTYTGDYNYIYSDVDAFWEDFVYMEDVIWDQTGYTTPLMRFPEGSDNKVADEYREGIMEELTDLATMMGYIYFDWDVDSGDGVAGADSDKIYENMVKGVKDKEYSIILSHDTGENTAAALEKFLKWGAGKGYRFSALDELSYTAHD